ncbi:phosphatidylinositol-glycan biosynthesis class W protein-like isoform X1 [Asterias rubens]|uniref:phosphatidylinositol-glycan biosynthesis class W protein-like isoform X1 n=1 Tax=Asterias rubens TaxID=7604 RepID=UPI001454F2D5|nr:phosphatidylinositol-glycan biosynthesis class W protein-like isoform X1 [Asterias rubens]XP_033636408.1 phosphatidylinositol-glycan biosynthesis class W protein-like isoform X1 [Asterias rubens]
MMDLHPSKEAFYANLTGTTPFEVSLVVAVAPASELLRWTLVPVLVTLFGSVVKNIWFAFVLDFITLVLPLLFAFTFLSDHLQHFIVVLLATSATLLLVAYVHQPTKPNRVKKPSKAKPAAPRPLWELPMGSGRPHFMTMFRVHGMVASVIAILAVDFQIFPRRFAKTETYGSGLMDVAVGSFMFMNALVSKEARGKHQGIFSAGIAGASKLLSEVFSSTVPVFVLGVIRLISVKNTGYHEHVSEYGVHWNFFFTLAVVIMSSSVCLLIIPPSMSGLFSLAIALGYQHLLSNHGLGEFVLEGSDGFGSREGLLNANREGLVSCVGYVAIYFAGVWAGRFLLKQRTLFFDWWIAFLLLNVVNVLLWVLVAASSTYIQPICRRTANLSYIIWTLSYCIQLLTSYMLVDIIITLGKEYIWRSPYKLSKEKASKHPLVPDSILVSSFSPNLLLIFLFCNLLTGAVNMSIDTVQQSTVTSMIILISYSLILCFIALGIHFHGEKLKIR